MKKMKISAVISAFAMLLSLTACSDDNSSATDSSATESVSSAAEQEQSPETSSGESSEATEEDYVSAETLSDEYVSLGELGLEMRLPSDFTYNEEWSCYTNPILTAIWTDDTNGYATLTDMKAFLSGADAYYDETMGDYTVHIVEQPASFYGMTTLYYVEFGRKLGNYEGCVITVSHDGGDQAMENTQTDIIKQAVATIRAK